MFILPHKGVNRITQWFGENPQIYKQFGLKGHNGIDYGLPQGTELVAVYDGQVVEVGDQGRSGYGKYVRIATLTGHEVTYGHMSVISVKKGQGVKQGDKLGLSGNTGFSTGPHLHLGVRKYDANRNIADYSNGYKGAIDPKPFFTMQEPKQTVTTTSTVPGVPPVDPERKAANDFVTLNKFMSGKGGDQPLLRQDAELIVYRVAKWFLDNYELTPKNK